MKTHIVFTYSLAIFLLVYLLASSGCQPCKNATPLPLKQKWKLVKVISKRQASIAFNSDEVLVFDTDPTHSTHYEQIYLNQVLDHSTSLASSKILGELVDCKSTTVGSVTIEYPDGRFRKYTFVIDNPTSMEATGYVNKLGGSADTLQYFYERIPN